MKPMGSCDGTSEYLGVCDATNGFVQCNDTGEVVRSKLFLGHFEQHIWRVGMPDWMRNNLTNHDARIFGNWK